LAEVQQELKPRKPQAAKSSRRKSRKKVYTHCQCGCKEEIPVENRRAGKMYKKGHGARVRQRKYRQNQAKA